MHSTANETTQQCQYCFDLIQLNFVIILFETIISTTPISSRLSWFEYQFAIKFRRERFISFFFFIVVFQKIKFNNKNQLAWSVIKRAYKRFIASWTGPVQLIYNDTEKKTTVGIHIKWQEITGQN